uniref:Putative secreted protein n=1 Tax=Panstrongylus lignarius TaxID=156445 RepID=A0A224Y6E1_9HEMI
MANFAGRFLKAPLFTVVISLSFKPINCKLAKSRNVFVSTIYSLLNDKRISARCFSTIELKNASGISKI